MKYRETVQLARRAGFKHKDGAIEPWAATAVELTLFARLAAEVGREEARKEFEAAYKLLAKSHDALLLELQDLHTRTTDRGLWARLALRFRSLFRRRARDYD